MIRAWHAETQLGMVSFLSGTDTREQEAMTLYRWIVVLALGPRALRSAWHVFVWLGMVLIVLYAVAANACSDAPPPVACNNAGTLGNAFSSDATELNETGTWSGNAQAEPVCFNADVKALCCPGACAVKSSPKWSRANEVLRSCARGLGCKNVDAWTVFMRCDCSRGK